MDKTKKIIASLVISAAIMALNAPIVFAEEPPAPPSSPFGGDTPPEAPGTKTPDTSTPPTPPGTKTPEKSTPPTPPGTKTPPKTTTPPPKTTTPPPKAPTKGLSKTGPGLVAVAIPAMLGSLAFRRKK